MGALSRVVGIAVAVLVATGPVASAAPGDLDPTFSNDGWDATSIEGFTSGNEMALQPDGKIVVVGTTQSVRGTYRFGVLRYLPDGTLDPQFGNGGKVNIGFENGATNADASAQAVAIQADGRIVVAGNTTMRSNGTPEPGAETNFAVARLASSGVLDPSFHVDVVDGPNSNGRLIHEPSSGSDEVRAVAVQNDGRIVIAGTALVGNGSAFALLGLGPDGDPDSNFGTNGATAVGFGPDDDITEAMTLQPDGRILIVGQAEVDNTNRTGFAVMRLTDTGDVDPGFEHRVHPIAQSDTAAGVAVQDDGKIVVAGRSQKQAGNVNQFAALRVNSDGTLDPTYGTGGKVEIPVGGNPEARDLVLQGEGKAVIVGETSLGAHPRNLAVVQVTQGGRPDPAFGNQPGNPGVLVADPSGTDESFRGVVAPGGGALVVTGLGLDKAVTARLVGTQLPALAASDLSVPEGSGGLTTVSVRVALDKPSGRAITVDYATAAGSAANGSDFSPGSGRLTFAPGETSKTVDITVAADPTIEPDEDFFLNLSAASNATIADGQARVVLGDDDTPPRVGADTPPGPGADVLSPAVQRLTVTRSFRAAPRGGSVSAAAAPVGGKVTYAISEPAALRFTVERPTTGRKVGRKCVKPTKKNRTRRKCTRYVTLRGSFTQTGKAGTNSFEFTGRLSGKKLRPGSYRLVGVATDAAGNKSAARRSTFRIVRR